jgi:Fe2+ or Zn2+ uptake regulation protein
MPEKGQRIDSRKGTPFDLDRVARDLRSSGRRLTRLKREVLLALARERVATAESLGKRLELGADLSPLYRCLASLEEAAVVTHLYLGDDSRHYTLSEPYGQHRDYMVCTNCSTVEELNCCVDDAVARQVGRRGFDVRNHQLVLRGLCSTCQEET